jgi:hypothetical protein
MPASAQSSRRQQERAVECVTPDEIVAVAKLLYESDRPEEAGDPSWNEHLADMQESRNRGVWATNLPKRTERDYWEALDHSKADVDRIVRVAAIVCAVLYPPEC